jgi:hypothetical protein
MALLERPVVVARVFRDAAVLRSRCGFTRPPFSTQRLVDAVCPSALVTGGDLPRGVHELVEIDRGRPVIHYSRAISSGEQRLAIAHALAHVLYDFAGDGRARPCPLAEDRADLFALEVLAPAARMRTIRARPSAGVERHAWEDRIDQIASRYHVPRSALLWRFEHFRLMQTS